MGITTDPVASIRVKNEEPPTSLVANIRVKQEEPPRSLVRKRRNLIAITITDTVATLSIHSTFYTQHQRR